MLTTAYLELFAYYYRALYVVKKRCKHFMLERKEKESTRRAALF